MTKRDMHLLSTEEEQKIVKGKPYAKDKVKKGTEIGTAIQSSSTFCSTQSQILHCPL